MISLLKGYTPQGYAILTDRETGRVMKEADTYTCNHARLIPGLGWQPCQRIIHVPANRKVEEVADFCRGCMKIICAQCATEGKGACTTAMKAIEEAEERDARSYHARRSYGF